MDLASAGLRDQPFRPHGKPLTLIPYDAFREARTTLERACRAPLGVVLLQGPPLSGKTTLLDTLFERMPGDVAKAHVNGSGLNTRNLLERVLRQIGYDIEFGSTNEMFGMFQVFVLQQAARHRPPLIAIENAEELSAGTLRAIAQLAAKQVRQNNAFKLVLSSRRPLASLMTSLVASGPTIPIATDIQLRPLAVEETANYLHAKLRAAGNPAPAYVFPQSVCNELWRASEGWPGVLDRVALLTLARAETLPVPLSGIEKFSNPVCAEVDVDEAPVADAPDRPAAPPSIVHTHNGQLLATYELVSNRILVGRSEHNDISIDSRFVSRHHLLMIRVEQSTLLMDLNSTNGTYINSRRVSNQVLMHNDVISVGHQRLKYLNPDAQKHSPLNGNEFTETVIMKTIEDVRALRAQEDTELLPLPTENLPTLGG